MYCFLIGLEFINVDLCGGGREGEREIQRKILHAGRELLTNATHTRHRIRKGFGWVGGQANAFISPPANIFNYHFPLIVKYIIAALCALITTIHRGKPTLFIDLPEHLLSLDHDLNRLISKL